MCALRLNNFTSSHHYFFFLAIISMFQVVKIMLK